MRSFHTINMAVIIIITDFSATAQNALRYASAFSEAGSHIELLLVNISSLPVSYSGDGVAMAAISDAVEDRIEKLESAVTDVSGVFPAERMRHRAIIGKFIPTLQEVIEEENAVLVVMGTPAAYGDIWSWDTDTLSALTSLTVPVMTIPASVAFKKIEHIAFASIPANFKRPTPIDSIKRLLNYTGAMLHVITVIPPQQDEQQAREAGAALHDQLADTNTRYHTIYESHIVQAIGQFVESHNIDLLVVRPRKQGVWYNLFHKSYAKELAQLNLIPVLALQDEWNIT
jgi:nucleotide-binding universal stress UspA family protein